MVRSQRALRRSISRALHGTGGTAGFKQFGLISSKLEQTLRDLNPIAIHASFGKSGTYALPLARKLGLPLAVTYYGGDATKISNTKDSFFRVYNRRRQKLWDEADLILPCSDFIRRELLSKGAPDEKMVVHHNTADPAKFQPGEKGKPARLCWTVVTEKRYRHANRCADPDWPETGRLDGPIVRQQAGRRPRRV